MQPIMMMTGHGQRISSIQETSSCNGDGSCRDGGVVFRSTNSVVAVTKSVEGCSVNVVKVDELVVEGSPVVVNVVAVVVVII